MKNILLIFLFSFSSSFAHAETFKCSFTEPFYTIIYETDFKILTVKNEVSGKPAEVFVDVIMVNTPLSFEVKLMKEHLMLMTITLTGKGSDGMSNMIYPFEANYLAMSGPNNGIGGCQTDLWPAISNQN